VKSMLDAGIKVAFESDRESYVWQDIELFITRKDKDGRVWAPQERVDRSTALRIATQWSADYVIKGNLLGSIEAGKYADMVVLDRDYMTIPEEEISEIQPLLTMLGGRIVHLRPGVVEESKLGAGGAVREAYKDLTTRRRRQR
jgi:predicted amidohydrolase YtcJ